MRLFRRKDEPAAWKGMLAGVTGGVAGTMVMTGAQMGMGKLMRAVEGRKDNGGDREQEKGEQQGEDPATTKAAAFVSETIFHHPLKGRERELAGQAAHYGFGTTVGLAYGVAAEYWPKATAGKGASFGAALMLAADEIAVPALHLSAPPTRLPASTHLYALAAHLVYGVTCEMTRRQVRRGLH